VDIIGLTSNSKLAAGFTIPHTESERLHVVLLALSPWRDKYKHLRHPVV